MSTQETMGGEDPQQASFAQSPPIEHLTSNPELLLRLLRWVLLGNTSVASRSIVIAALGLEADWELRGVNGSIEFGRAAALMKEVPELKDHFGRVAQAIPQSAALLAEWDMLAAAHEKLAPGHPLEGDFSRLLRQLISMPHPGETEPNADRPSQESPAPEEAHPTAP